MTPKKSAEPRYDLPRRNHCKEAKVLASVRLPADLKREVEGVAARMGWDSSDVIITALDQFVTWAKESQAKAKR